MTNLKFYFCFFIIVCFQNANSQDIHFSQIYNTPLNINPALAGVINDLTVSCSTKQQWTYLNKGYKTIAASFDMKFQKKQDRKHNWGFGFNSYSDRAGDGGLGVSSMNLSLAHHVNMGEFSSIGGALQVGFQQYSIDSQNLQWANQFDGVGFNGSLPSNEPEISPSRISPDVGMGVVWNYDNRSKAILVTDNHDLKINAGLAVYHINRAKYSFLNETSCKFKL